MQFPAALYPRGSDLRCTHREIDQVAETYRVMGHSPSWCWGFEQGVNEHGVAIGNHATWSREPLESEPGLIGMDLVRLGLERGRDAREALEVIASLLETHGQGGPAFSIEGDDGYQNSFVIADGRSAWVLETTNRSWAARSVDGASLTNALTLGSDWQIGSRNLERRAVEQGFWKGAARLDFRAAYGIANWPEFLTERRQESSKCRLEGPPLSLDLMKSWLRDHGNLEGPPDAGRAFEDPDRYSVCMHSDPMSMTTASLVVRLPSEVVKQPWPVWISFATPCTGVYLPVYLDGVIPATLASVGASVGASIGAPIGAKVGQTPGAGAAGVASVWCAMRELQDRATDDFDRSIPIIREGWLDTERMIEAERVRAELEASRDYAAGNFDLGDQVLSDFMAASADRVLETAKNLLTML